MPTKMLEVLIDVRYMCTYHCVRSSGSAVLYYSCILLHMHVPTYAARILQQMQK